MEVDSLYLKISDIFQCALGDEVESEKIQELIYDICAFIQKHYA